MFEQQKCSAAAATGGNEGVLLSRVKYERPPEGANMARELREAFKRHSGNTLLVDVGAKREWSGAKLLDRVQRCATNLIRQLGVQPNQVALMMCDHSDLEILFALGHMFAGGAIYGSNPQDGYGEEKTLCELVKPDLIATNSRLHHFAAELKRQVPGLEGAPIVWVDNPLKGTLGAPSANGASNGSAAVASNGESDRIENSSSSSSNSNNDNNDNNNNNCSLDYYLDLMERDRVVLLEDLMEGPLDERLIERVIYEQIKPAEHILTYMLTSGSTGRPKIVPSTHEELMHGLYSMISANNNPIGSAALNGESIGGEGGGEGGTAAAAANNSQLLFPISSQQDIFAGDLPLDHGAGVNTMFLALRNGSKFIVIPSYDEDSFWQSVSDHQITVSVASTTFTYKLLTRLKELVASGEAKKRWNLDSFRYINCCGSKMAFIELVREINKEYPHLTVTQSYGATEIGFIAMLSVEDSKTHLHSVGHLFPGLKAKVVDRDTGLPLLGPNQLGELHVWAASKFKGYKCYKADGDPAHLVARCHDQQGFYKTGDQAHSDEQGRLYIHGRFKDTLFLMQDWKILPAELEAEVDEHPLVEQSVVVGVPDPKLLGCDAPRAYVKLISQKSQKFDKLSAEFKEKLRKQDWKFIEHNIYSFVADRTAEPKHLKGGVKVVADFPYVGTLNKVDRKALRAQFDAEATPTSR